MSSRSGFSLFEVLIAFAILSLVLVALIPGQAQHLARAAQADQQTLAFDFALSKSAELGITAPLVIEQRETNYRNWIVYQNTYELLRTERGLIVETEIRITLEKGSEIASLKVLGFIADAP